MAFVFGNWSDMRSRVRISLVIGVAVIVVLTLGAFWWLASDEYQVLFADLEPRDAASVVSELERMKVNYHLENGGAQILVPESSVYEVRLKLMGAGVPLVGGVGFEIFDNSNFGMTEFAQRINYQRALEGELTRTVMSLKEVKYARVHLVMPERGVFQQDDSPPSASVTLFLETGRQPDAEHILGIQRLVASSVPRLKVSQVMVTDQNGLTLSRQTPESEGVAAVSGRLEQKQAVEKYLRDKVDEVLERNFGAHQAMVSIDAVLDFSQVKRTREDVLPSDKKGEGGVLRRRETRLGSGQAQKEASGNVTTEIEYRLGRTVEQVVETPGKIVRLSVGVMVPAETPEARREEIRELVKMAVGFVGARGDAIAVYAMNESIDVLSATASALPVEKELPGTGMAASNLTGQKGRSFRQESGSPAEWVASYPLGAGAFITAMVLIALYGVYGVLRKPRRMSVSSLSEADRKRVLEDVRRWLDRDDESKGNTAG